MPFLTEQPIDAAHVDDGTAELQDGASVEFLGIVRSREQGRPIAHLTYEAYAPMAEQLIGRLIDEAKARWPLHQVQVRHRVGRVPAGEVAVLVRVRAAHRDEAFEACRFVIDALKRDAPIWKFAPSVDE